MPRGTRLTRRRLDAWQLKIGMYVCEVDRPWRETPFLFQGFPLLTAEDIQAVQACCQYVFIDELQQVQVSPTDTPPPSHRRQPLSRELQQASHCQQASTRLIEHVFERIVHGHQIDVPACRAVVRDNLDSLLRNESAMLWLTRLKSQDEYTSQHCIAVSIMAMGFGQHLGLASEALEQLGLCGLLHDVGKIRVDQRLLNKPDKLTPEEFEHIKGHARLGYALLKQHADLAAIVSQAAHGHHERLDGTGYPQGLQEEQIPYFTRIISIVDCFDAITSQRVYDRARSVKDAFKVLMDERDTQFDAELVMRFIEWLGIFPVGTLVELHTGEVGVVLEKNPRLQLRPKVAVLVDREGQRCPPRFLDLARICVDGEGQPYRITACLPDGALGLHMADPQVRALVNSAQLAELDDEAEVPELLAHWAARSP